MKNSKFQLTLGFAIACAAVTFSLAVRAQAQTVTTFAVESSLGMVQATDGNFYGAGYSGNYGGIFRMTPTGRSSTVYKFCSLPNCADGTEPKPPILGSDGNLYGVARFGGNSTGSGTFYKLTLDGNLTVLYTFCPNAGCADGQYPVGVVLASDGNFYGTTENGGATGDGTSGTIFRISPTGEFKLLYTFCSLANCADGLSSSAPIQGSGGDFYGAAALGGANGLGVVYRLTSAGAYTVLYNFCSATHCLDGEQPQAVTQGPGGTLFGVTNLGGNRGCGTVFEITLKKNHYRTLHNFDAYVDGCNPFYALTLANDGNFYGVVGDPFAAGYIFEETPGDVYTSLYNFACCGIGTNPFGPLLQATNGELYGEVEYSGSNDNSGAIFQFSNGIGPSVQPVPVAGKAGNSVIILGNGLTGSTSVAFNGVAATFTVESDTYIKATVPPGATTGTVSVVTPSGVLKSNSQFVVTK